MIEKTKYERVKTYLNQNENMKDYQNNQEPIIGISKPLSKMDKKEKEQIHLEIESKMEELEATGLSKEELI